jgi:hypothetical protein
MADEHSTTETCDVIAIQTSFINERWPDKFYAYISAGEYFKYLFLKYVFQILSSILYLKYSSYEVFYFCI